MAIVGRAKYTRARAKFRGEATRGECQKLETTDVAREFEISRYIPIVKLFWIIVNNLATVHKPLSTLVITSTPFQVTEMADRLQACLDK